MKSPSIHRRYSVGVELTMLEAGQILTGEDAVLPRLDPVDYRSRASAFARATRSGVGGAMQGHPWSTAERVCRVYGGCSGSDALDDELY